MSDQTPQLPPPIPSKEIQRVLTPGSFKGMNTALTPSALQDGQFALVQNLRPDDGSLMCRYPTTQRSTTGLPTVSLSISGLSDANPIVVTTSASHHLSTGDIVTIAGALGNTAANGTWVVTALSPTTFSIPVAGNGTYTSGATLTVNQWHGFWNGTLNGTEYIVAAVFDGTKIGLYFSTDGLAFAAASQTSGAYGDTRMSNTGKPFSFAPVNNPADGTDYLVISNGTDSPRAFSPNTLNGSYLRVVQNYAAPTWATPTQPIGYFPFSMFLTLGGTITATATGGNLSANVFTNYGAVDYYMTSISIPSTVPAYLGGSPTDYVVIDLTQDFNFPALPESLQIVFASDQFLFSVWSYFKLEVSNDNATWTTISDPSSATYYAPIQNQWTAAWPSPQFPATGGLNSEGLAAFNIAQIPSVPSTRYLRISWVGAATSGNVFGGNIVWTLHGAFIGGNQLAFDYSWTVSQSGQGGTSESPGVVYSPPAANTLTNVNFTTTGWVTVPYTADTYYFHKIPVQVPSLTDLQNGADYAYIYQAQATEGGSFQDYFYIGNVQVGEYVGGAWVYEETGTTTPPIWSSQQFYDSGVAPNNTAAADTTRYAPSPYVIPIPNDANVIASTPQRLFAGSNGSLAFSENVQPFRFFSGAPAVNGSIPSQYGNTLPLPGQNITAFATTAGGTLGAYTVWAWTQTKTYMIQGFDCYSLSTPNEIAEVGVSCPNSVAAYKDVIWFIDDNLQLREFRYGRAAWFGIAAGIEMMPAISRFVVDNITTAIPKNAWPWVQGVAVFDRYYLAYPTPSNAGNFQMLIYEETRQCFFQDTLTNPAQSLDHVDLLAGRFLFYGGNVHLYTHEDVTSSAVQSIVLNTREGSSGMWDCLLWGRVGVVMDVQSGQTLNITRVIKPNTTDASTTDLSTNATGQVWRWDTRDAGATDTVPGQSGLSCQLQMTWTMTPGTRLYTIVMETQERRSGADML